MKKIFLAVSILAMSFNLVQPLTAEAYNYGDFRSETLVAKAWAALKEDDIEAVLAYTNKCIELYAEQAQQMQATLSDYAEGSNDDIFAYWALNDVATALFIQGEAYRQASMNDESVEIYQKLMEDYSYGQTWDPKGWFWKPAEAAKEKVMMITSGTNLDFGDYTSSFLTTQAWKSLLDGNTEAVAAYTGKVLDLYEGQAATMQASLTEYPWESKEKIFSYWALNDVGTSLYIMGDALKKERKYDEAKVFFKMLVDEYYYAQCWDPKGWFWKPADAAQQALDEIEQL